MIVTQGYGGSSVILSGYGEFIDFYSSINIDSKNHQGFTLSVNVTGGQTPYSYKWYKKDDIKVRQIGRTPIIHNYDNASNTTYTFYCVVTDSIGIITISILNATTNPSPSPTVIFVDTTKGVRKKSGLFYDGNTGKFYQI